MSNHLSFEEPSLERQSGFISGAFLNRRYTRLSSSVVLSLLFLAFFLAPIVVNAHGTSIVTVVILFVLNAVLYPLVREVYFRLTQPMREGIGNLFFGGLFVLILWAVKIFITLFLWMFSFLVGIPAFLYLAITEAKGRGWRILG